MRQNKNLLTKGQALELVERMFLLMTGIYLLCQCVYNSTYVLPCYTFPDRLVYLWILVFMGILALLKVGLVSDKTTQIPFMAVMAGVYFLTYRTGRELFLLMIPALAVGAAGMDYRRILKVYVVAVGSFLTVTILCAFTGVITNIVFAGNERFRSSWGIAYPTDFASLVLFLVMMLWLAWEQIPDTLAAFCALISLWVSWTIAGSRTGALCSLMLLGFILLHVLSRQLGGRKKQTAKLDRVFHRMLIASFLIFAALYFIVTLLFVQGTEIGKTINILFSYRPELTVIIFRDQGLHAFGSNYPQVGLGGSLLQAESYYFLDSSYPLILIRYGWVLFLMVIALWTCMGVRVYRSGDRKFLYVMAVIAFHAMSEHHFLDVQYNILLSLPFAAFPSCGGEGSKPKLDTTENNNHWATRICVLAEVLLAVFAMPWILSRLHTVFDIWGVDTGAKELRAVGWCIFLLAAVVTAAVTICRVASKIQQKQNTGWKTPILALLSLLVLLGMGISDSRVIHAAEQAEWITSEEDKTCLLLSNIANGKVYADERPELMYRRFPGFRRSLWYGNDMARLKNVSVVVNLHEDRISFERQGFQFAQISPEHAVYSCDADVIEAMMNAGYLWTKFDTAVRDVDLREMAEFNETELNDRREIYLENGEKLRHGPYLDFYAGAYQICFDLKIDKMSEDLSSETGDNICTVFASTLDGKILAQNTLKTQSFERDGTATAELSFETDGIRYVQFPIFPAEGKTLEVTRIYYRRTA